MEEGTYWPKSNIGIVLSGRILLFRNHHPAENGAIGTSRLVLVHDSSPTCQKGRGGIWKGVVRDKRQIRERREKEQGTYQIKP